MTNVLDWLEEITSQVPSKIAFDDGENTITFEKVKELAQQVGATLVVNNFGRGAVAYLLGRKATTPAAFIGAVYAGCFYAPLDGTAPKERLEKILERLQPVAMITDEEKFSLAEDLAKETEIKILKLEDISQRKISEDDKKQFEEIRKTFTADTPLYVIHTSGSSGIPKGVLTGHGSLMNYINGYAKMMGIEERDVLGNQSPLDYIAAIRDIYLPLKTGASTYIIPKKDFTVPALLFDDLTEKKVTCLGWSVNAMTIPTNMGAFEKSKPEYLKKVCFSGSVMPCKVLRIWQENLPGCKFVNQYGPTEATASCTYYAIENKVEDMDVLPIGKPFDNYEVFLLNEDGSETKDGEIGEICVGGAVLALGYLNDEERTRQSFVKDERPDHEGIIYKTGDLGRMRPDGNLEFHGRKDRQIKYLGHRVELGEIEEAVKSIGGIEEAVAMYKEESEQIFLVYTGRASVKEIAKRLREIIPGFMVPRKFINLEKMPALPNGKIDMQAIKELI